MTKVGTILGAWSKWSGLYSWPTRESSKYLELIMNIVTSTYLEIISTRPDLLSFVAVRNHADIGPINGPLTWRDSMNTLLVAIKVVLRTKAVCHSFTAWLVTFEGSCMSEDVFPLSEEGRLGQYCEPKSRV